VLVFGCLFSVRTFDSFAPPLSLALAFYFMTQVYQYNIQNKGDGTRFIIYSMKELNRVEQFDLINKYMQGRTHLPTKLKHDIVISDDRPADMMQHGDVQ
jgi:hypothetical protein